MDQKMRDRIKTMFGFEPVVNGGHNVGLPVELVIIKRKFEEFALPWQQAHDRITELRAKYERSDCAVPADEALRDHEEIVRLDRQRAEARQIFYDTMQLAKDAGYTLPNGEDIKSYCPVI
ncbi:MAG: hypothetical protein HY474_02380 [Candidatus Sungbacteria bacterium]|uniref:Uncharacterized protein n=1 Tax=Candidatus Sungiibacteriota bacterium TaxID=2750080 RepID=A0A932YX14_9BACT|nr:hypothetical protein [Candidatus Sungbacteria bacterium]